MNVHVRSPRTKRTDKLKARLPAPTYISIRDLQKLSAEGIAVLAPSTPIKSGDRTVALLTPLKKADPRRLAAVLRRAKKLAKGRDAAADDEALAQFGEVDPANWDIKTIRKLQTDWLTRK